MMMSAKLAAVGAVALASFSDPDVARLQIIDPATLPFEAGRLAVPSATVGSPNGTGL